MGLTIGHGFKSWHGTASWSLFGLIYTAIKNSLSRLQPLQGISYECFCVNERKIILKNQPSKIYLIGSRTHNLVNTRPLLYHLHHHFLLKFNIFLNAHYDLLIPLFVANVHMISNRKTFVLNHTQLGFKFEKFYLSKSD